MELNLPVAEPPGATVMGDYISWDKLFTIIWRRFDNPIDGSIILEFIREKKHQINHQAIKDTFGERGNGIRLRAVKAAISGHYAISYLEMAS